ncbi:MAG: hypothetical protein NC311_18120 [Muribaculaceae bacterium]|nr:hypothetical protein [Muribaculaceae bacterium]
MATTKKDKEMQALFQSQLDEATATSDNAPIPMSDFKQDATPDISQAQADIENMDLYAFLPAAANDRVNQTKVFPGPPGWTNADGTPAMVKVRKLSFDEVTHLSRTYREKEIVRNKKGRIETTTAGRAAVIDDVDGGAMTDAMIAKSLVFPNLRNEQLQHAYGCPGDERALVRKIFNTSESYNYIARIVGDFSGLGTANDDDENTEEQLIEQAKN